MTDNEPHMTLPTWMNARPDDSYPPEAAETTAGAATSHRNDTTLMTPNEVCDFLQVTKDWLYDQIQAERLPHIRLGRHLRFRRSDLQNYLDTRFVPATPIERRRAASDSRDEG